jgi:NADPH2:quinone reductase
VHAGAGGVGHIAIQLAKWAGAVVYTTISTKVKADLALSLGATEAIYYHEESVEKYVERLTHGGGFAAVFDTVGDKNINKSPAAVAHYGNVVTILSCYTHDFSLLLLESASIHVEFMLLPLLRKMEREGHGQILMKIAILVDEGVQKPIIDPARFSFEHVGQAHALLESGAAVGKVVISRERFKYPCSSNLLVWVAYLLGDSHEQICINIHYIFAGFVCQQKIQFTVCQLKIIHKNSLCLI